MNAIRMMITAIETGRSPKGYNDKRDVWVARLREIVERENQRRRPPTNQRWIDDLNEAREVLKRYVG